VFLLAWQPLLTRFDGFCTYAISLQE
jgi:hypothetical protein